MHRRASLILAALILPGVLSAEEAGHGQSPTSGLPHDEHVTEVDNVHLIHAWSRATDGDEVLVFLEIENDGSAPVLLSGGEAAIASTVEVVGFVMQGGTQTYVALGEVPIAAGARMTLGPDGVALRLTGVAQPLREGESFGMIVRLGDLQAQVTVAVEAADAEKHSHAGHDH